MTYEIMFYGGIIGALITLPIAIVLFVKLQIVQALEDLTGFRLTKNNRSRKKSFLLDTSGTLQSTSSEIQIKRNKASQQVASSVEKDSLNELGSTTLLHDETEETTVLEDEGTTILTGDETTLLKDESTSNFVIEKEIIVVHSSKMI